MHKYDSPRDEVLRAMTGEQVWGKDSGDLECLRTGKFCAIDLTADDFPAIRNEYGDVLVSSTLGAHDRDMIPLVGYFIVQEFADGRVTVTEHDNADALADAFRALEIDYVHWLTLPVGSV